MLFNSIEFAIFMPIVLTIFWLIPIQSRLRVQNILVTVASNIPTRRPQRCRLEKSFHDAAVGF